MFSTLKYQGFFPSALATVFFYTSRHLQMKTKTGNDMLHMHQQAGIKAAERTKPMRAGNKEQCLGGGVVFVIISNCI